MSLLSDATLEEVLVEGLIDNPGISYWDLVTSITRDVKGESNRKVQRKQLMHKITELTQRGFQSNARVITTADEMLQELVALRR